MEITLASEKHINEIETMIKQCIQNMNNDKIYQWDDKYPNKQTFQEAIHNNQLFVLIDKREIIGIVIINEKQNKGWENISWSRSNKVLVIHSLAVKVENQRKGNGANILRYCEDYAKRYKFTTIRLDAFSGNERANNLYLRLGYRIVSEIEYLFKPKGHQKHYCYEKIII